jgi:hypothetical protein
MGRFSSLVRLFVVFLSAFGHHRWNTLIPGTGLIVCFIWSSLADSSKHLNTAKFTVIHELGNQLPVALGGSSLSAGSPRAVAPLPGSLRT